MKNLMIVGLVLLALGGALMIFNTFSYREKHETNILGAELSVTTKESKRIPYLVSGTILGVGAALTIIGALKRK